MGNKSNNVLKYFIYHLGYGIDYKKWIKKKASDVSEKSSTL